jgi:competence protein ComGG
VNNEKGFILPVTLVFSFFVLLLFAHSVELYKMEAEFANHEEKIYELDSLMQMAVTDIKSKITHSPQEITYFYDEVTYPIGRVQYTLQRLNENEIKVMVVCISNDGFEYGAEFTLSIPSMELIEWKEKY